MQVANNASSAASEGERMSATNDRGDSFGSSALPIDSRHTGARRQRAMPARCSSGKSRSRLRDGAARLLDRRVVPENSPLHPVVCASTRSQARSLKCAHQRSVRSRNVRAGIRRGGTGSRHQDGGAAVARAQCKSDCHPGDQAQAGFRWKRGRRCTRAGSTPPRIRFRSLARISTPAGAEPSARGDSVWGMAKVPTSNRL